MDTDKDTFLSIIRSNPRVILNMFNTIIGVGIITLPSSILSGGFFFFLFYALVCVYLIYYTSMLMAKSSLLAPNIKTYGELCWAAHKDKLRCYVCLMNFLLMFGFISVYCITLRHETQNLISEITGETFKHGRYVLLGMSAIFLFFTLFKNLSFLAYGSFVSAFCVLYMIAVSCARAPFYQKRMSEMTREKMLVIEPSLDVDRAIWACSKAKAAFELEDWPSLQVENYSVLENSLHSAGVCLASNLNWEDVRKSISEISTPPAIGRPVGTINDWLGVVHYEHPRQVFHEYSLNEFGRRQRNFTLFSVFGRNPFVLIGILAAAFIYQQAAIENFQSMKSVRLRDYKFVMAVSFVLVFVCCMVIAFAGYFSQQYQVGPFIFTKLKLRYFESGKTDYVIISGRIALIVSIILTFPMQFYFGRVNLMILVVLAINKARGASLNPQSPPNTVFYVCTLSMFSASMLIGLFLEQAKDIFSLIGAAFAGQMIYILPVICWYALKGGYLQSIRESLRKGGAKNILTNIIIPNVVLVFGVVITICSTVVTLLELVGVL